MPDITTAGWDTVFALRLSHVNALLKEAIASGKPALPTIEWWEDDVGIWAPLTGFAFVGDSSLSGSKAKVAFSVAPATLRYQGDFPPGEVTVVGDLDLRRIDDPRFVSISAHPATDFQISHIDGIGHLPALQQSAYKLFFQKAVAACLKDFEPVLASIDLQTHLPQSAQWLAPITVGHCLSGGADAKGDADEGSTLAILCMTDPFQRGNPLPPPSFDGSLIPATAKAAFLISGSKFTRNLLFTGLAQSLFNPGRPLTSDQLTEIEHDHLQIKDQGEGDVISMKPGSPAIALGTTNVDVSPLYAVFAEALLMPFLVPGAVAGLLATLCTELATSGKPNIVIPVPVEIQSLEVQRHAETVTFNMGVRCEVNIGQINLAVITLSMSSNYKLTVAQNQFQFVRNGEPFVSSKDVALPSWLEKSETAAEIIGAIVGVIVTVVTEGEAAALIGVSIGLIEAGVQATPQLISTSVSNGAGVAVPASLDGFVATAVSPVAWLQATSFKASSIALGEAILFAGEVTSGDSAPEPESAQPPNLAAIGL